MSETESHDEPSSNAHDAHTDRHSQADAHGQAAAHGHEHTDEEMLGPIDVVAWAAGIAGVAIGLVMWLCFVMATSVAGAS
jgi:ABC-type nickel/cobalt efflux system permease component RcnA